MRTSFIGRGPEAHTARTDLVQRTPLISLESSELPGDAWSDVIHETDLTVMTTTEDGWPETERLAADIGRVLDVASFKSRRHGILLIGAIDGATFEALRRREDLCWYAHADTVGSPVHCDDLEGQRTLERLLGTPSCGPLLAVAA